MTRSAVAQGSVRQGRCAHSAVAAGEGGVSVVSGFSRAVVRVVSGFSRAVVWVVSGFSRTVAFLLLAASLVSIACGLGNPRPHLLPVSLPDVSRVDPGVQTQTRERYAAVTHKLADRATPLGELGDAYGALGMVLQAAEYYDAAEPAYLDAQMLAPAEIKLAVLPCGSVQGKRRDGQGRSGVQTRARAPV